MGYSVSLPEPALDADPMPDRKVITRKIRRNEDDGSFDHDFWQSLDAEARFAAMWEMVSEVDLIRGKDGRQPGLQRHVHRLERRGG